MPETVPRESSLVLYKNRPARVRHAADKLEIELEDGKTLKVRPKDVTLLHPGPLHSLAELQPQAGEVQATWELLAGGSTTLRELAELAYGTYTPASAWAAWGLVADGLYFRGTPDEIVVAPLEEVASRQAAAAAEAAEKLAWNAFLKRASAGQVAPEDDRYLRDVEALALGRSGRSRVLRDLNREESPENAHALLLDIGYWDELVNPYPARLELTLSSPSADLPDLPEEPRADLTHLPAFAVDDEGTETPDDALSIEGGRLWVHVADAAALVLPGSPADLEARARGTTLHLPEAIVPMLPAEATPRLGLGLAEVSPALSFGLDPAPNGQIAGLEIVRSWVRVARLTYEEAEMRLEEEPFRGLYNLAQAYEARRLANGAISIELPEVRIRVVQGEVLLRPLPPLRSRSLVENAMIMAGEAVARFAIEHNIPLPFAMQEPPEDLTGLSRPVRSSEMFALRRALKRSQYRSTPAPHSGLGLSAYAQATSPLRRYLDLVVHQQLRSHLHGKSPLGMQEVLDRIGATEAVIGSVRQVEQLSNRHWTHVYLRWHPRWRGEGILVDKHAASGKFLIPQLALEVQAHLPTDLPLDSTVTLILSGVDLPRLDARFRVER